MIPLGVRTQKRLARLGIDAWGFPVRETAAVRTEASGLGCSPDTPTPRQAAKKARPRVTRATRLPSYRGVLNPDRPRRPGHLVRGKLKVGLRQLSQAAKPGQTFTRTEIAAACDVSHDVIRDIELVALQKLRVRLTRAERTLLREQLDAIARNR